MRKLLTAVVATATLLGFGGLLATSVFELPDNPVPFAVAEEPVDETDSARNAPLPCEAVHTAGAVSRSSKNIAHIANVCGIVGTDMEFQSRKDLAGKVHDYAFVGTMGGGFRIFDVTDPANPSPAGGYIDSGWQNDIQVRGDIAVSTFDGLSGEDSTASTCLKSRPGSSGQGVDIFHLTYNARTADFEVNLLTCVANPPGGAHNSTLSPSGQWLAISNSSSDWAVDVIDLRNVNAGEAVHRWRLIDSSRAPMAGRCPAGATFTCVIVTKPDGSSAAGLWRPHDIHFSKDSRTMYVAALNSTFVVDVRNALSGQAKALSIIPNISEPGGLDNPRNIELSHQADVSPDGAVLVISDERGGGLNETRCNREPTGVVGALHFWALKPIKGVAQSKGASPTTPKKLGSYFNPNPLLAVDPLQPWIDLLPRTERGCTVHVFRIGGNGSSSPGEAASGFGGVSTQSNRRLTTAWYGAGVWWVDFSGPPSDADGIAEDGRSSWGNTLGWNVMPGADTWSGKEYKGEIYAGDMLRGFDVYTLVN